MKKRNRNWMLGLVAICSAAAVCWVVRAGLEDFQCTEAKATVEVPAEGNPTFHLNDHLTNQSDHMVVGKRVAGVGTEFVFKRQMINTSNGSFIQGSVHGSELHLDSFLEVWNYDLKVEAQLDKSGGFAANAQTYFKVSNGAGFPSPAAEQSHAFTVVR